MGFYVSKGLLTFSITSDCKINAARLVLPPGPLSEHVTPLNRLNNAGATLQTR